MASVDTVLRLVRPFVRNCPDVIMRDWVIEAARNFCQQTRWLRESIPVPTLTNVSEYALSPVDTSVEVTGVFAAEYQGRPLTPSAPEEGLLRGGSPTVFWFLPSKEIVIADPPYKDGSDDLTVSLLLQPIVGATTISDELLLRHDQTIAQGAIWRLASMPGAGWSNPQLAADNMGLERIGIANARAEADMQHRHFDFDTLRGF